MDNCKCVVVTLDLLSNVLLILFVYGPTLAEFIFLVNKDKLLLLLLIMINIL